MGLPRCLPLSGVFLGFSAMELPHTTLGFPFIVSLFLNGGGRSAGQPWLCVRPLSEVQASAF